MSKLITYDVRTEVARGRYTRRVRATTAQGAREACAQKFPSETILTVKRSTYAR